MKTTNWARIYIPKETKYLDVEVKNILDFQKLYREHEDNSSILFKYERDPFGPVVKCQIIRVSDTLQNLHKEGLENKRKRLPKLNASMLDKTLDSYVPAATDNLKAIKTTERVQKKSRESAKQRSSEATATEILKAHYRKASVKAGKKNEEHDMNENQVEIVSLANIPDEADDSESDGDRSILRKRLEEYQKENAILLLENQDLAKQYFDLKESKQYPMTEETGQKILAAINNAERLSSKASLSTIDAHREHEIIPIPEMLDFGENILIKKRVYDEICKHTEPSRFVISLAQNVWNIEDLAERCVRRQANIEKEPLETEKKQIIEEKFVVWLRKSQKYPEHLVTRELSKMNKYFNSAITGARKKVNTALSSSKTESEKQNFHGETENKQNEEHKKRRAKHFRDAGETGATNNEAKKRKVMGDKNVTEIRSESDEHKSDEETENKLACNSNVNANLSQQNKCKYDVESSNSSVEEETEHNRSNNRDHSSDSAE